MPADRDTDQRQSTDMSWPSVTGLLLKTADRLAPGQLVDIVPLPVHPVTAAWPAGTRSVLLWLTRIRPQSRSRYLDLLNDFLLWSGLETPDQALRDARSDARGMQEVVRKYVLAVDERRTERLFAYSALRSFFARAHYPLPGDIGFDVGGTTSQWWVNSGRPADSSTTAEGIQRHGAD